MTEEIGDVTTSRLDIEVGRVVVAATNHILNALDDAGMTQKELAAKIGATPSHVSQVLTGERNMTLKTLVKLGLGCGILWSIGPADTCVAFDFAWKTDIGPSVPVGVNARAPTIPMEAPGYGLAA